MRLCSNRHLSWDKHCVEPRFLGVLFNPHGKSKKKGLVFSRECCYLNPNTA